MKNNIKKHIKSLRFNSLPEAMLNELKAARKNLHWSQAELGRRTGLPQMHISGIETGKIVPRFDTLIDIVRVLGFDLLLVPRPIVPAAQSLIRHHHYPDDEPTPVYASEDYQDD